MALQLKFKSLKNTSIKNYKYKFVENKRVFHLLKIKTILMNMCALECDCLLCKMQEVIQHNRYIPWITLSRIFYLSLMHKYPSQEYFSVKTDVPQLIESHWTIISKLSQFSEDKWRKSLLDAINHSRFFISGKEHFHVSGFWKLKDTSIPFIENYVNDEEIPKTEDSNESSQVICASPSMSSLNNLNNSSDQIREYYINIINQAKMNISALVQFYPNADINMKMQIQSEVKINEETIQRASFTLFNLTDQNSQFYSSACFMVRTVF
ncbi:hypothetical protein EIN_467920 [Entamoeba invadens IP1]|uniref:Uncharacterized protein n=1 Tax=Entamoeba invadens IP1 TaxID=370355 RepID=A0A0A1TWG8_ENTIV|nr:hypothetical protein EIN_467920 [Entamoeba invadens IP1]ELP83678.1 hypothetical protein EIN_467920 [Entamoeba invadens IP1]|eukprot:XP_004183024.1 hypothetical protein EIN_467920 [Entamoeba invadens IP1]